MTKSSVNFKAVKSASHAVSHASREIGPTYLLAPDKSMGTIVLLDDKGKVASTLQAKLALASRQALREKGYSPIWEGVINLPRPEVGFKPIEYKKACSDIVSDWCKKYETSTGHKVLRADVHLDEGHMVDGETVLNAHAHVIADRTNDLGRVMQLSPKMLRDLQTLTAEVTGLERGKSSFETGRKHIEHQAYKYLAERGRLETQQQVSEVKGELDKSQSDLERQRKLSKEWSDADLAKVKVLEAKLDGEPARLDAALKAQEAQLKEQYRLDREALKTGAEKARQADYQALKKAHEADLAKLKADAMAVITPLRTEVKTMKTQITQLTDENTKLAADKARFTAMATAYEAEKAKGTPAHLIAPGAAPAPVVLPSQSNKLEVPPLGPNARARLRAEQMAQEAARTASEPLKHQEAPPHSPTHEKEQEDTIKEFYDGWIGALKAKGLEIEDLDASKGDYHGPILDQDDVFAVQKTGRQTCVIHQLSDLSASPDQDNPKLRIQYKAGRGHVTGVLQPANDLGL